jgi:hypothetical protein
MENELLQPFLKAGLLDLGDSDTRIQHIKESISDLITILKDEVKSIPTYTLVALDPNIDPSEPVLAEVEEIVVNRWEALRSKFKERPVPLLRAVILIALYELGKTDDTTARLIYLSASNFYPYANLGRESSVVEKMIVGLGEIAESNAVEEWALVDEVPDLKLGGLKVPGIKAEEIKIDTEELMEGMLTAINADPVNNYGPQHGTDTTWSKHFAKESSEAINNAFSGAFKQIGESLNTSPIETAINKFFTDFKKSLDKELKNSFSSIRAVERRSKLLWWKETLYSPSLKDSYRVLNPYLQPFIMAVDLCLQLPLVTPASVDYLLRDTLLLLNPEAGKQVKFLDIFQECLKAEHQSFLEKYKVEPTATLERMSVKDYIINLLTGKVDTSNFEKYTGIPMDTTIKLTDFAVLILHDSLTENLIG